MPTRACRPTTEHCAPIALDLSRSAVPTGLRFAEQRVNSSLFFSACCCRGQMQVHSVLRVFLDANRRRLELGRSGLGIHGVNREIVRRYLLVKMDR